jgi:C_GCAxxG_C_C family probable redox protein
MSKKEEILQKAYDLAYKYEAERGSCPQCVAAAIMETLKVGDPKTVQAADALAGGTALTTQGTCGALVGGLLAIGAVVGRTYKDFSAGERKRRVFMYSKKLYDKFVEEYGSPLCKDVHMKLFGRTFNLLDPKDYQEFENAGAHVDKCTAVSGNVARWAAEIILDIKKD